MKSVAIVNKKYTICSLTLIKVERTVIHGK